MLQNSMSEPDMNEKETRGWESQASVRNGGGKGFFRFVSCRSEVVEANSFMRVERHARCVRSDRW